MDKCDREKGEEIPVAHSSFSFLARCFLVLFVGFTHLPSVQGQQLNVNFKKLTAVEWGRVSRINISPSSQFVTTSFALFQIKTIGKQIRHIFRGGKIHLWNINKEKKLWEKQSPSELDTSLSAFSPDDKILVGRGLDNIAWYDLVSCKKIREVTGPRVSSRIYSITEDGKFILGYIRRSTTQLSKSMKYLICWDFNTGEEIYSRQFESYKLNSIHLSFNGKVLIVTLDKITDDPTDLHPVYMARIDPKTGKTLKLFRYHPYSRAKPVSMTYDGSKAIVSARRVAIWDTQQGKLIKEFEDLRAQHVCFLPDGKMFAIWYKKKFKLLDANTGKTLLEADSPIEDVTSMKVAPNGKFIVLAGGKPNIWNEVYLVKIKR